MCRNWKLWAAIAVVAVGVAIFAGGGPAAALPLLLVAACPLAMVLMGAGMALGGRHLAGSPGEPDDANGSTQEVPGEVRELRAEVERLREQAAAPERSVTAPR